MKKVILGSALCLAGILSVALLMAGAMAPAWTRNGEYSAFWNLERYGLMPAFYILIAVAAAGLLLAVWGILGKKISASRSLSAETTDRGEFQWNSPLSVCVCTIEYRKDEERKRS